MSDEQKPFKTGRVKWFDAYKGYGFIIPDDGGRDILFHATICRIMRAIEIMEQDRVRYRDRLADSGEGRRATVVELALPLPCCPACGRSK